jgi:DNA-binding transcriptional regulator YdaS (Cro superfamily)
MDAKQVLAKFGTQQAMAQAFGVTKGAVSQWLKAGRLPKARAWQYKAGLVKPPKAV